MNYKEINGAISKIYEIPFNPFIKPSNPFRGPVEDEIESSELSFFRNQTNTFSTIDLKNYEVYSQTLNTGESMMANASKCLLSDKTYIYCCNFTILKNVIYNRGGQAVPIYTQACTGLAFKIDENKNISPLITAKINYYLDSVFYDDFIYLLGGINKLAERCNYKQNKWESIAPLPQGLNFTNSCSILFRDSIMLTAYSLQNIIIYSIPNNNYQEVPNLALDNNCYKCMLRGNNRIYLFEKGKRIFESAENDISYWEKIGYNDLPSNTQLQSVVVRYEGSLYFVHYDNQLWRFNLSSKQLSLEKII